jgi:bifunctional non-homologous end joining protein LigD
MTTAYLDGELCGVRPDGTTSFSLIQNASDSSNTAALVFFAFDLLYLDAVAVRERPCLERKERLAALLQGAERTLQYSDPSIPAGIQPGHSLRLSSLTL